MLAAGQRYTCVYESVIYGCVCAFMCACVCVYVFVCVYVCVRVCVSQPVHQSVHLSVCFFPFIIPFAQIGAEKGLFLRVCLSFTLSIRNQRPLLLSRISDNQCPRRRQTYNPSSWCSSPSTCTLPEY